jgi:hypothetical protein
LHRRHAFLVLFVLDIETQLRPVNKRWPNCSADPRRSGASDAAQPRLSILEATEALNVSPLTARTQLKSVFAKTGVSRQAELIRLIVKSVAMMGN